MTNCKKIKTIAILLSMVLTTACNNSNNNEVLTVDQKMYFDVTPDELDIIIDKGSTDKAAANAAHSQDNIEGTNYMLHTIIDSNNVDEEPSSRAFVSTLDGLKASGFTLNTIVTENATGKKHLYMRDTPVSYNGSNWIYSPIRYWPDISIYKTVFYAFRTSDFASSNYEGDNMLPTMKYTVPVDPTAQKDIITALNDKNDREVVKLQFKHRMTSVRIKTRNIDRSIIRLEFSGIYDDGTFDLNTMTWNNVKLSDSNPNGDFKYYFVGSQLLGESSGTEAYVPDENGSDYYFMMLPQDLSAAGRNAKVKVLFDNGTIITAPLKTNWEAGKSVTYLFTYDNVTRQWLDDSNCYLINPINTSNKKDVNLFAIPISYRINTFWQNEGGGIKPIDAGTEYVAEVIWQDANQRYIYLTDKDGISFSDSYSTTVPVGGGDNECIYFKLSNPNFSGTCNIVLGVRRKSESTYLWSWHLWLTEYYPIPESSYKLTNAARVPVKNGTIERYDDPKNASEQVWDSMPYHYRYLMDRNIGAVGAADGTNSTTYENSFDVYYQFGRKDPFPRNGKIYKIDGSFLGEITATDATLIAPAEGNKKIPFNGVDNWPVVKTVQYPLEFVTNDKFTPNDHKQNAGNWRNPSWYPAGVSIGSKSFYDPCPPGWRLPNGNIFYVFSNNQTFTSKTITVSSESKLTDGEDPIGIRFRISTTDPSFTTDMLLWSRRYFDDGTEKRARDYYNSFIWRSENFVIFQIYNFPNGIVNLWNTSDHECYGAQIRAIHE